MKKITFIIILIISSLNAFSQPANDTACNAETVPINTGGTCSNLTYPFDETEIDENDRSDPACASNNIIKDRWYKFQMPANGKAVKIVTSDTGFNYFNPAIEVFAASNSSDPCNTLVSIGCDSFGNPDQSASAFYPQIIVSESINTHIYFRIWFYEPDGVGDINMCLFEIDTPIEATNDECLSPELLLLSDDCSSPILKTLYKATSSLEINPSCATNEGGDVWFELQVPNDKAYDITVETSEDSGSNVLDTGIAIYSGTCDNLFELACDKDSGSGTFSQVTLTNQQDVTLYVRVFPEEIGENETFYICASKTATLGIEDKQFNNFIMYPNPAKDIVNLKFSQATMNIINISIYNIQGKLVKNISENIQNNKIQLSVSGLQSGLYFLKVNDGIKELTKKLFVK